MRSILALFLALLILAAEAPGLFTESPVCAAVDGRGHATVSGPAPAKSCCGTASCPMREGRARGMIHACSTAGAHHARADRAPATGARLCAASCGAGGISVLPATPDPGTLERSRTPAVLLAASGRVRLTRPELPSRNPVPDVPPPRL